MRKVAIVVALLVAGLVAYNYMSGGGGPLSDDQAMLEDLEYRFDEARRKMSGAGRSAGLTGIDTSSDAESARLEIDRILNSAEKLAREADRETRASAERFERRVREYREQIR
jgi:hypothetical protein